MKPSIAHSFGGRVLRWLGEPARAALCERGFLWGVATMLVVTAGLKLAAGFGEPGALPGREKVFGVPMQPWSIGAALAELATVGLVVVAPDRGAAMQVVRFFFATLLGYRLLFHWSGGGYCGCLGTLLARSPWQGQEGLLLGGIALACFATNELLLGSRRFRQRHGGGGRP